MPRLLILGRSLALPVVLVSMWWMLSAGSTDYLMPPLQEILRAIPDTWVPGHNGDIAFSLRNLVVGYLLAVIIGVSVGLLLGLVTWVRNALLPAIDFMRSLPSPVLLPLFLLALGAGTSMRIVLICFGSLWPVLLSTLDGVRSCEQTRLDVSRMFHLRRREILFRVILPDAGPQILSGMRSSLQVAFLLMVISEMIAATQGMGHAILTASRTFQYAEMWAGILLLGALGLVLNLAFDFVEHRALRWKIAESRLAKAL